MLIYDIKNLNFSYNSNIDNHKTIFNNFNLEIEEGHIYSLLGINGAGKSTLFYILLNIIKNYNGDILFMGDNIKKLSHKFLATNIGYVPQNPKLSFDYTAYEYISMGLASKTKLFTDLNKNDYKLVDDVFDKMDINHLKNKYIYEMSGGEKQEVVIARSIVANPKIVLFDEPTTHLDIANQYKVLSIIKELNKSGYTILLSTHDPNHVSYLKGKIIILDNKGHNLSDDYENLFNENILSNIYNTELVVEYLDKYDIKICFIK